MWLEPDVARELDGKEAHHLWKQRYAGAAQLANPRVQLLLTLDGQRECQAERSDYLHLEFSLVGHAVGHDLGALGVRGPGQDQLVLAREAS